jgi:hypothetical protein
MHSLSGHQIYVSGDNPEPYTGIPYKKGVIIMGENINLRSSEILRSVQC